MKKENSAAITAAKRKKKQADYMAMFKKKQRALGFKELRGLAIHEKDKRFLDALIETLNEARRTEIEDSDIMFRIDNNSENSVTPDDGLFVTYNRIRYRVPCGTIQPGSSFIVRRGQLEQLLADEGVSL